jgi:hypothetical protein
MIFSSFTMKSNHGVCTTHLLHHLIHTPLTNLTYIVTLKPHWGQRPCCTTRQGS